MIGSGLPGRRLKSYFFFVLSFLRVLHLRPFEVMKCANLDYGIGNMNSPARDTCANQIKPIEKWKIFAPSPNEMGRKHNNQTKKKKQIHLFDSRTFSVNSCSHCLHSSTNFRLVTLADGYLKKRKKEEIERFQ